jgi:homeobox protein cut-like
VLEEKKDNWEAKEKHLEEKVENQERLLKEIKASYEVSQRLAKGESIEDTQMGVASAAELEMVNSDLERTSVRLAEVESRNEQLRLQLAQSATQQTQQTTIPEDDPAFLRMQSENSALLRKLDAARFEKSSEKRDWDSRFKTVEREVSRLKDERDSLRERVSSWGDYEVVKGELEVLKVCSHLD